MKRLCFIINPVSGHAGQEREFAAVKWGEIFDPAQFSIELHYSAYPGHAGLLSLEALRSGADVIVACGGDGTINEVASPLVGTDIPLGLIPRGSGNGLLTHLKIPKKLNNALEIIRAGCVTAIDAGRVEDRFFFSNTGTGYAARVIAEYESIPQRKLSAYIKAGWTALQGLDYTDKYDLIDAAGEIVACASQVVVSNSNMMGYGVTVTPQASLVDGRLDVIAFDASGTPGFIYHCMQILLRNQHADPQVFYREMEQLTLSRVQQGDILMEIDGEIHTFAQQQVTISTLPAALRVIIPEKIFANKKKL